MPSKELSQMDKMKMMFKAHPWHGIDVGDDAPETVNAYIEMLPTDTVKYEVDKKSGMLKVDRPQKFSSMPPMLYGFIPQTYSGKRSAEYCNKKTGRDDIVGDQDPVDICILTERPITSSNILVPGVVIGGFRMIDNNEADDKIIAFLKGDMVYSEWEDIADVPEKHLAEITQIYNKEEAYEVIRRGRRDYDDKFLK